MMELFTDATAEQRFALMLQERVDSLSDEVERLKSIITNMSMSTAPDLPPAVRPARLRCPDMGCRAACAFVRASLVDAERAAKFVKSLERMERLRSFGEFTKATATLDYGDHDAHPDAMTVQALVLFDRTCNVGAVGAALCDANPPEDMDRLEMYPVVDVVLNSQDLYDNTTFEWYMCHIAAGQKGRSVDSVVEVDVDWYKKGAGATMWMFMGNIPGLQSYDDLYQSLEARGAWGGCGSLPWHVDANSGVSSESE